jgi:serpin B
MAKVVEGNNQFAFDLYVRLRAQAGNAFVSPYSLSSALAMTYAGARGETAGQMAKALHFSEPPERLHSAFRELNRTINGNGDGNGNGKSRSFQLSVANALWAQQGERFLPEFLRLVEENYGAGLREVDFQSAETARRTINQWIEEQTQHKIKDLLAAPYPGPGTVLVLTNAIYFKGTWASPFSKQATRDEDFRMSTGQAAVRVPTMHQIERLRYLEDERFQALALPYAGNELEMVVLLPRKADGLAEFERSLTSKSLAGWLDKMRPRRVDLALPRFKIEMSLSLKDRLAEMGMPQAFGSNADFSGMNGQRDLFLSAVIHKAYVDVNEEGTEAAAATAAIMTRSSAVAERPVAFRADHPFVFLIRHARTGSVLFLGRVADPR